MKKSGSAFLFMALIVVLAVNAVVVLTSAFEKQLNAVYQMNPVIWDMGITISIILGVLYMIYKVKCAMRSLDNMFNVLAEPEDIDLKWEVELPIGKIAWIQINGAIDATWIDIKSVGCKYITLLHKLQDINTVKSTNITYLVLTKSLQERDGKFKDLQLFRVRHIADKSYYIYRSVEVVK